MREIVTPSGALAELLAKDGTLDEILSGRGLRFEPAAVVGPPPSAPQAIAFPVPDWDEEERLRLERDQQRQQEERRLILEEELARLEPGESPEKPTVPAAKQRSPWRRGPA